MGGVKFERFVVGFWQRCKVRLRLYNEDRNIRKSIAGTARLTAGEKAQIEAFYEPYFKAKPTSHLFYKEKTGEFHVNYVPDYIWYGYIDPYFNSWTLDRHLDNKCYYHRIFPHTKMPELMFYRLNDFWFDGRDQIVGEETVRAVIRGREGEIFLKMADSLSGCGLGVTCFAPATDAPEKILPLLSSHEDMVIQGAIKQHTALSMINSSSVNTIRIMSLLRRDGTVRILSSVLRIGRNGKRVDNASAGGITCGIDSAGRLRRYAYTQRGERFECHPDSGFVFNGAEIPGYMEAEAMVRDMCPRVPHFRLVSWDIAVGLDGLPILIEMNPAYGELDFHQLNNGPIFKDDTKEILDEVFGKVRD